ncbi:MAG TPA: ATP-binding protein [Gaiellaceae bacterium]|nr:ATP-binding protein [Gaiellaceae bacterium]
MKVIRRLGRVKVGIRWWLAIAFALIAAGTAASIATVSSREVRQAVGSDSRNNAIGKTVSAGFVVEKAHTTQALVTRLGATGVQDRLALFVFARDRHLIAHYAYRGLSWAAVPAGGQALDQALAGRRFAQSYQHGKENVVALPIRQSPIAAALVAYAPGSRGVASSLSIFENRLVRVSIWAAVIAALIGLVAATLVSRRVRRITETASAIERGGFDLELRTGFPDEIGSLAGTIDRMRRHLGEAFTQLQAERDRFEILLDRLQEGVIAVDELLTIQFANSGARAILGDEQEWFGEPLPASVAGLPLRSIAEGLFVPDASVVESEGDATGGTIISAIGIPAGSSKLAILVLADITERERRQRAEREFVANASHELRTPITAIANAVEALEAGAQDEPEHRETFIRLIGRQSLRLTRLTNSLLILARAQTLERSVQLVPVSVRPLLDDVVAGSERKDGPPIRIDCSDAVVALAEPDILEQIVSNLLGNAIRYGNSGLIAIRAYGREDDVVIEVSDTGPGMSVVEQSRIFDRFYSGGKESRNGFGLGLAIVRDATLAIGGRIEVASREQEGTVVRLILGAATLSRAAS